MDQHNTKRLQGGWETLIPLNPHTVLVRPKASFTDCAGSKAAGQNDTSHSAMPCSSNNGSCVIALALRYARTSFLTQLSCQNSFIRFKRRTQGYNTVPTGKCLPTSRSNTPSLNFKGVKKAPPWRRQYIRNWRQTVWAIARPKVTPRFLTDLQMWCGLF